MSNPSTDVARAQYYSAPPRLSREPFPRLTDEQWRERRRVLRRLQQRRWYELHQRERERNERRDRWPPKPKRWAGSIISYLECMRRHQRRDERRQRRRASGFV